jgi:hypothetical protein
MTPIEVGPETEQVDFGDLIFTAYRTNNFRNFSVPTPVVQVFILVFIALYTSFMIISAPLSITFKIFILVTTTSMFAFAFYKIKSDPFEEELKIGLQVYEKGIVSSKLGAIAFQDIRFIRYGTDPNSNSSTSMRILLKNGKEPVFDLSDLGDWSPTIAAIKSRMPSHTVY